MSLSPSALLGIGASALDFPKLLLQFDRDWRQEPCRGSVVGDQHHVDALLFVVDGGNRDIAHVYDPGVSRYVTNEARYAGVGADDLRRDAPFVKSDWLRRGRLLIARFGGLIGSRGYG